ncbi:hypothetical protein [Bacillus sp. ISL-77]|uniref:hypothetical protein n=1 Tax=Bacillus sp. ISL-77 TaxID=2819138 RepID=UPI001BE6C79B|nr:hypothetical protein [Bacillus sp. ISL-77]MBT2743330.1 hypothetical protein [Bacillus sp. ISL-77]
MTKQKKIVIALLILGIIIGITSFTVNVVNAIKAMNNEMNYENLNGDWDLSDLDEKFNSK